VLEALTPDFYLPNQNLYIELTTLRPKLNTKKNRKLRKMNKLYPDINIKLFKRRDIRDMLVKFGMDEEAQNYLGTEAQ
jgi:hypoxanthine phosphoribosyltransferase